MRRFIYLTATFVISSIIFASCHKKSGNNINPEAERISYLDSTMRHLGVALYSNPDSISLICSDILSSSDADSITKAYAATVKAMAALVTGDVATHDSLLAAARIIADAENACPQFREYYYRTLGVKANLVGDNHKALEYTDIALKTAIKSGNSLYTIENEAALGDFYQALDMLPEAATHMRRAISLADSIGYSGQRSLPLSLAEVYSSMGNFAEADRYFALHREKKKNYPVYTRFFYHSTLGNSMYFRGRYDQASDNFRKALDIIVPTGDPFLTAMSLVNLGESLMLAGQIDSAARYINEGVGAFASIGVQDHAQSFYLNSLKGALALYQGNLSQARSLLEKVSSDTTGVPLRYQGLHFGRLADLYTATGEYAKALSSTNTRHKLEMRLYDQSTRQYASELEYRYMQDTIVLNSRVDAARKHEEVLRLRSLIWTCVAIALASLLAIYIYAAYQSYRRRRMAEEMQASLLSMRLENTRNRISPHFVFNMLNNTLSDKNNSDSRGVEKFVSLIRRNLELAEKPVIPLIEEIEFVDIYIDFLQHSHTQFEYHKQISDNVDMSMLVPSMLIEIFVENAIKHGLRGFEGKRDLWLNIMRRDNRTFITVANNGMMTSPSNTRGTGTGTRIVSQTIQVLNERNDRKIEMSQSIKDYPDVEGEKVYVVTISIPDGFDFSALSYKRFSTKK